MAAAGSAEHPASAVTDTSRPGSGPRSRPGCGVRSCSSPPENHAKKCAVGGDSRPSGSPACPLCPTRRQPGSEERLRQRSDPGRVSSRAGRRDCDPWREFFVFPALPKSADVLSGPTGKQKGVLSDSENEEPISRRIRNISAFIRKTKNSSSLSSGAQRSRSCTDPMEDRGGKMKVIVQPAALMDRVGISHSSAAGILLSSENSRCFSAPVTAPDRRLTWRAVLTSSTPLSIATPRVERSVSPESNDSISEELNHFKPIVCSPCTPPKRLPDGRLVEPTIVKSTPRNLSRGLQKATSYEASPAVLQKWRQIELDRQNLKVTSKATLTSPISDLHATINGGEETGSGALKMHQWRDGDSVAPSNKRRILFDASAIETGTFQKQSIKIRVPAITPEPGGGAAVFSGKPSFSPFSRNSCKLVPKDCDRCHNQNTSKRGTKRKQKTKHLDQDVDLKRSRPISQEPPDERFRRQIQQDRVLALKLQRKFDLESRSLSRRLSPDPYFLRSWMSTQNCRRHGLRRSKRLSKKH
ncbi:E3 ubiquitin-protein ligase RNF169 [Xenentodon cancila]